MASKVEEGRDGAVTAEDLPKAIHLTTAERAARGKTARSEVPRASHAALELSDDRDPVGVLDEGTAQRVPELVPIRYGRMLTSPFAMYRGAAAVMAHDRVPTPRSGRNVQLCGDAHLANFGGFASPERSFVFDLNDFDETLRGPFEWDVKRLAASFEVAGRNRGFGANERRLAVLRVVRAYREAMRKFAAMGNLEVWYSRLDIESLQAELHSNHDEKQARAVARSAARARTKDSMKALSRLTQDVDGEPRIVADPPLVVPIAELTEADESAGLEHE